MKLLWLLCICLMKPTWAGWPKKCVSGPQFPYSYPFIKDNMCYIVERFGLDFRTASFLCESSGGDLMYVNDMQNVMDLLDKYRQIKVPLGRLGDPKPGEDTLLWVGAHGYDDPNNFTNCDGSKIPNNLWAPGEPNHEAHDERAMKRYAYKETYCVAVSLLTGKLYDDECKSQKNYICQYKDRGCNTTTLSIFNSEICGMNEAVPYNTKINIKCKEGFYLEGPASVSCQLDRSWSEQPTCYKGCPVLGNRPNARLILGNNKVDGKGVYICDDGHVASDNPQKTHFEMTCKENGEWVPLVNGCVVRK